MSINNVYQKKVAELLKSVTTVQENVHSLIIESLVQVYKTRNTEYSVYLINQLASVQGSFRVQAVIYFFQEIAGLIVSQKDGEFTATLNKEVEHNKELLAICKIKSNRFWKITPNEPMLKFCKLESVFNGSITQLARALQAGEINRQQIEEQIEGLYSLIKVSSNSKTTFEWLEKFKKSTGLALKSESSEKAIIPSESIPDKLEKAEAKLAEETIKSAKPLTAEETEQAVGALQALSSATK